VKDGRKAGSGATATEFLGVVQERVPDVSKRKTPHERLAPRVMAPMLCARGAAAKAVSKYISSPRHDTSAQPCQTWT